MDYIARILVRLKRGVLDPQGRAIHNSLNMLGFKEVTDVRVGKLLEVRLKSNREEHLKEHIDKMCQKLLANPVIEDYEFEINKKIKPGRKNKKVSKTTKI